MFAPKYRRQVIYGKIKADVGKILIELSERKGVEILAAESCPEHIHMLVAIPSHMSVSSYLEDDIANDQMSLKEFTDPLTGEPVKEG